MDNEKLLVDDCAFKFVLDYDNMCNVAYGRYKGFDLVVNMLDRSSYARYLNVSFSASYKGGTLNSFDINDAELPAGTRVSVDGYTVNIALLISTEDIVEKIAVATDTIIERVKSLGGERCDAYGTPGESTFRHINGKFCFVSGFSSEKVATASNTYSSEGSSYEQPIYNADYSPVKERPFRGILGALIASVSGGLLVYLLGDINLFKYLGQAALLLIAFIVPFFYKLFAKKFSTLGIIVSVVFATISVYLATRIFAAGILYDAFNDFNIPVTFSDCFKNVEKFYSELKSDISTSYFRAVYMNAIEAFGYTLGVSLVVFKPQKKK